MRHRSFVKKALRSITLAALMLGTGSFVYAQGGQAGGTLSGQSGAAAGQGQALSGQSSAAGGPRDMTLGGGAAAGQGIPSKKGSSGDYSSKQRSGSSAGDSGMGSSSSQGSSTSGTGSGRGGY